MPRALEWQRACPVTLGLRRASRELNAGAGGIKVCILGDLDEAEDTEDTEGFNTEVAELAEGSLFFQTQLRLLACFTALAAVCDSR